MHGINKIESKPITIEFGENSITPHDANGTHLSVIAEAFEELSNSIATSSDDLRLLPFTDACSLVSLLFGFLGIAFKFAELKYVCKERSGTVIEYYLIIPMIVLDRFLDGPNQSPLKIWAELAGLPDYTGPLPSLVLVRNLVQASKTYNTLKNILDYDVENDTVRKPGSLSRNLRRVRQGLELIKTLFEQFLSSDECSLREAASTAYAQACAPYHTWAIRTAVFAAMYALPTREQLLLKLNETDSSAEKEMRRYIKASLPVIEYIDNLYISRNISLDW
ncbi:hypothetical protein HHK36_024299 [Tetracentron sinense]|uniref:Glycolipid transfer protein domain-containing protein n=1 Tax=Tetracentron sinense TaxID=13715 RepID=A0A834YKM1_TETSI|nr:hypothetical protein HHK36_024299 [Tetracentron sinense]